MEQRKDDYGSMADTEGIDAWPAARGIETLQEFEEDRRLTQRALQNALARFCQRHIQGSKRVLEIGSGLGFLRQNWPSTFRGHWIELEPQGAFLRQAAEKNPPGTYVQGSAYALPFADQSFETVCGYGSFDVFSTLENAVQEVERVLQPGGLFFHMLDVGANHDVIRTIFEQQRIPLFITRSHRQPYMFGMRSGEKWNLRYLPPENIPAFLEEVGMSQHEMDLCQRIGGDFAYRSYVRKSKQPGTRKNSPSSSTPLDDVSDKEFDPDELEDSLYGSFVGYQALFERHSNVLDADDYFRQAMVQQLSSRFGSQNVQTEKLVGVYRGKRTEHQKQRYPSAFAYHRDVGLLRPGMCTYPQLAMYKLHQWAESRKYHWARFVEPTCTEVQTLDLIIARKL